MANKLVGHSSDIRTLDQRELASLRPQIERRKRTRSQPVLRQVTSGIKCFCGEQFGEHQSLEFMLHLRAEFGQDLAQLDRYRVRSARQNRSYREGLKTDPERHEHRKMQQRAAQARYWKRLKADPERYERHKMQQRAVQARRREKLKLLKET